MDLLYKGPFLRVEGLIYMEPSLSLPEARQKEASSV